VTVTKRTRYEVLRRDVHTCRYCHATDQPLTVDHVVPVALGGTDDPSNLVAACKDCNAGKSSSSPDGSLVAQVRDDALRQAQRIEQAYAVLVERMGERDEYIDNWAEFYTYQPLPADWRNTIGRWFEMGVPLELVVDAARIACGKTQEFRGDGRFAYMCGIVWNQVHAVREVTATLDALEASIWSDEGLDNERVEAYNKGWENGQEVGWMAGAERYETKDLYYRALTSVVDRTDFPTDYFFLGQPKVSEPAPNRWAA
jgi:hypothetical protein